MQVIIDASDNERPLLEVLDPICVEAGTLVRDTVSGQDPNFDDVKIEAFGGSFEFISSPSTYFPNPAILSEISRSIIF